MSPFEVAPREQTVAEKGFMRKTLFWKGVVGLASAMLFSMSIDSSSFSAQSSPVSVQMLPVFPTISQEFSAPIYTSSDGALTVHAGGNYVDPYFATKALLAAQAAGLNIDVAGKGWINWLRLRQRPNGLFDRYQQVAPGLWQVVAPSDADDAMLALWLELLNSLSPKSGLPTEWRQSARRARIRLDELRNPVTGVYNISTSLPVGLLMDNTEIYGALQNIARSEERFGQRARAQQTRQQAAALAASIQTVFWRPDWNEYSISTQDAPRDTFYPYAVAQLYPIIDGLPTLLGQEAPSLVYSRWLTAHSNTWLQMNNDPYPWGLVALAGVAVGDDEIAIDWMAAAAPLRYSARWNVLEEAIFQGLDAQLS